jgi:hypothetical protein
MYNTADIFIYLFIYLKLKNDKFTAINIDNINGTIIQ